MRMLLCWILMAMMLTACGSKESRRDSFFQNGLKLEQEGRTVEARIEKQGLYRHEQSPPAKQGTDLKGKGLAFSNDFTSGKLGLCPFSLFYHRKINAQFSSIFFIRSCSFLATCILRLLANIIISLLTRRQRETIASIIPKKLNPNKINE